MKNLFRDIPDMLPEELISVLAENESVRIERIVSDGHASPEGFWYDQEESEWILLLSGSAVLEFEHKKVSLSPGDYHLIPAHQRHRVESTSPTEKTIWLAVFYHLHRE
ncbi:MAG: cupin domain-containing protein [Pontiellaceae bacterium]|nr:cupin domain-containing protein [Pontiellaceae bacterium]MBN2784384.1 cupin domain-containing protein [Pontiellaceae bacterium]